jgi:predicted flap endonuclease-1-like 5' DNA nuclease
MIRRRRPLLRAAAVGGGAYVAGKRKAWRQAEEQQAYEDQDARISQLEQQQAAPPAAPAPAPAPDRQPGTAAEPAAPSVSDQLSDIKRLHDQGILTEEEFSAAKAKVLGI